MNAITPTSQFQYETRTFVPHSKTPVPTDSTLAQSLDPIAASYIQYANLSSFFNSNKKFTLFYHPDFTQDRRVFMAHVVYGQNLTPDKLSEIKNYQSYTTLAGIDLTLRNLHTKLPSFSINADIYTEPREYITQSFKQTSRFTVYKCIPSPDCGILLNPRK
jgi:hypothetical protein